MSETHKCPYCGDEFEDKIKEGIHRAEEHIQSDDSIANPKDRQHDNLVRDWDGE